AVSVSDVDAGANPLRVTLTATNGVLTLGGKTGLTFSAGDGTDDATMTFAGSQTAINAALAGLKFTPTQGFTGAATLQVSTDDQGNTGSPGPRGDSDTVNIAVNPLPLPPPTPSGSSSSGSSSSAAASAALPDVFLLYARPRRGRQRFLRVNLTAPASVPL